MMLDAGVCPLVSRVRMPSPALIFLVTLAITPLIFLLATSSIDYLSRYSFKQRNDNELHVLVPVFMLEGMLWLLPPLLVLQAQQDISSLKNIAGETGKKLSSLASTLMTDFGDRIL